VASDARGGYEGGARRPAALAFATGSVATGIFNAVPAALLLYYMTDTLAVPVGLAPLALVVPKITAIVTDPLFGSLSDRTRSRWGRRRPYLFGGGLLLCAGFIAIFNPPWPMSGTAAFLYVLLTYGLASIAYALYSVPYIAMPAEMSDSSYVRTRLMALRMTFLMMGLLIGSVAAPALISHFGGGAAGYAAMAWVLGGVSLAAVLCVVFGTARAVTVDARSPLGARPDWRALAANRSFAVLIGVNTGLLSATGCVTASLPYVAANGLGGDEGMVSLLLLALVGTSLVSAPAWPGLSLRMGKARALACALGLFAAASLALFLARGGLGMPFVYVCLIGVGAGFAGGSTLTYALLTDVIAQDRDATGADRGGLYTGIWTALEKIGMAIGPLAVGLVMQRAGYVASTNQAAVQPAAVHDAVFYAAGAMPAVAAVAAMLLIAHPAMAALRRIDVAGAPATR
jgi:Na+/melibiose symporter-like transporter